MIVTSSYSSPSSIVVVKFSAIQVEPLMGSHPKVRLLGLPKVIEEQHKSFMIQAPGWSNIVGCTGEYAHHSRFQGPYSQHFVLFGTYAWAQ